MNRLMVTGIKNTGGPSGHAQALGLIQPHSSSPKAARQSWWDREMVFRTTLKADTVYIDYAVSASVTKDTVSDKKIPASF